VFRTSNQEYRFDEKEKKEMLEFLESLGNGVSCFDGEWRDYVISPQIFKSEGAASKLSLSFK